MRMRLDLIAIVVLACCTPRPRATVSSVPLYKSQTPIPEKDNATLPLWLVDARILQGQDDHGEGVAIVDTGAQTTVVDRQWADAHGLRHAAAAVVAKDISGASLETSVARDVRLRFGEIETPPVDLVVIEMPELLRALGIVVIWSPQTTVPSGKLLRLDFARATIELRDATELAGEANELCLGERFGYAAPLVSATVGGHAARLELDSGSSDTSLSLGSDAGAKLAAEASDAATTTGHGAAGAFTSLELGPRRVQVGSHVHHGDVSLFDGSEAAGNRCPGDGVIGLPFMAQCVLDLSETHFDLRCPTSPS